MIENKSLISIPKLSDAVIRVISFMLVLYIHFFLYYAYSYDAQVCHGT